MQNITQCNELDAMSKSYAQAWKKFWNSVVIATPFQTLSVGRLAILLFNSREGDGN